MSLQVVVFRILLSFQKFNLNSVRSSLARSQKSPKAQDHVHMLPTPCASLMHGQRSVFISILSSQEEEAL